MQTYTIRPRSIGMDMHIDYHERDIDGAIDAFCRNIGLLCVTRKHERATDNTPFVTFTIGNDKSFTAFAKIEPSRADRFVWQDGDLEVVK